MMNIHEKTVLITGGSSGLGLSLVRAFLDKGAKVVTTGTSESSIKNLKKLQSKNLTTQVFDIRKQSDINNLSNQLTSIDILINNAGVWFDGGVGDIEDKKIISTIETNLSGPILLINKMLSKIKKSKGFILTVASSAGLVGRAGEAVYAASKFGLRGFTDALRQEMIGTGVRVVGVYPGGMKTPFYEKQQSDRDVSTWMNTDDVAKTIIHIVENDNTLTIDNLVMNRKK